MKELLCDRANKDCITIEHCEHATKHINHGTDNEDSCIEFARCSFIDEDVHCK